MPFFTFTTIIVCWILTMTLWAVNQSFMVSCKELYKAKILLKKSKEENKESVGQFLKSQNNKLVIVHVNSIYSPSIKEGKSFNCYVIDCKRWIYLNSNLDVWVLGDRVLTHLLILPRCKVYILYWLRNTLVNNPRGWAGIESRTTGRQLEKFAIRLPTWMNLNLLHKEVLAATVKVRLAIHKKK